MAAPTWQLVREAFADATELDGRLLRTLRAVPHPGRLTLEYLQGRRIPYLGPLKLFLSAGAILSATWVITRRADARFYRLAMDASSAAYIDIVLRGLLAASLAIAVAGALFSLGRRRLVDEVVFALHAGAAVALWTSLIIWLGTAWKVAWGTYDRVPAVVPSLPYLLFLPATIAALTYLGLATRRVYRSAWTIVILRVLIVAVVGVASVTLTITVGRS